jgi:ABC-type sugar transport system ATPase subunit
LGLIKLLASRGVSVIVISHNLTDVFEVADRIAVMYLGTLVSSGPASRYDTASAVEMITTGSSSRFASTSSAAE